MLDLSPARLARPCIWRNRAAFQSLVAKFRPSSICFSSKRMSCPVGAIRIRPKRKPSAPYFAIRSSGSGELPNDFAHLATLVVADQSR